MRPALALLVAGLIAGSAPAGVISITPAQAGPVLIDFGAVQTFAPVNGQTIGDVLFNYLVSNVPSTDAIIGSGPGNTNNITVANVVNNFGSANSVLRMTFPSPQTRLGYGYSIAVFTSVPNATTVDLFDASNNLVGALSANGVPDPFFTGGFLGVQSDIPFVRADVRFNTPPQAFQGFAFDNVRFQFNRADVAAVPEPLSITVFGGLAAVGGLVARRRMRV